MLLEIRKHKTFHISNMDTSAVSMYVKFRLYI